MSIASSRSTFPTSGIPCANHCRARSTSKRIISQNAGRVLAVANRFFAHAEAPQILQRKINPSLVIVHAHVLPEIRQLQRGASVVGKPLPLGIAIAAQVQHQMPHRIRRIAAVAQQIVERLVAADTLILPERGQQIGELCLGISNSRTVSASATNTGCRRMIAVVAGIQLRFPLVEQLQRCGRVANLIAQIVGDAAIGINIEEMLAQPLGKKPGSDRKILVVRARQPPAIFARLGQRGRMRQGSRTPAAVHSKRRRAAQSGDGWQQSLINGQ